jgi:tRNA/tmRNA/rRNA uracil-C5-methylase (TrmA/RlmC/RlmD family)
VSPGELLEVTVSDLARGGAGVARDASGRVIFSPYSAPGDRLRVRVTEENKHYAQGEIVEVFEASKIRVKPPCAIFGQCGGCQWQHLPYELQWSTKVKGVGHALERVQVKTPENWLEYPAERIWEYRNRIQLRGEGREIGFFARGSHRRVPADRCEIARPEINAAWEATRAEAAALPPREYKVEVEVLPSGEIRRTWNAAHGAAGFRQIHDEQNARMVRWIEMALTKGRELLDLYGGSGNLSRDLAPKMARVDCVDVSSPAEPPAGTPANLTFHRSAVLPWLLRRSHAPGAVLARSAILDPPREGLGKDFIEIAITLEKLGVNEIVAVGCDPDSWARDVSRFLKRGWRFEAAAVFDFFPQTPHVESVALLRHL